MQARFPLQSYYVLLAQKPSPGVKVGTCIDIVDLSKSSADINVTEENVEIMLE